MNANIDITGIILKTDRLILRNWRKTDLDDFYEYCKVPGVGEMAGWVHHENIETSMQILSSFIETKKTFCIEYNGKAIGSIGIEKYDEELLPELDNLRARELGFVLSKDYWGLGIMPEACRAVLDYLFYEENLNVVVCGHFLSNNQSKRCQEKLGFKEVREHIYKTISGLEVPSVSSLLYKEDYNR